MFNTLAYTQLQYTVEADSGFGIFDFYHAYSWFFFWQKLSYSGAMTGLGSSPIDVGYSSLLSFSQFLGGLAVAFSFNIWLRYVINSIGMFLLVREFTKNRGEYISYFSGVASSFIFTLEFNSVQGTLSAPITFLPFAILFLSRFFSSLTSNKINFFYFSLTTLSFAAFFDMGGFAYAIQDTFLIVLIFIVLILTERRRMKLSIILYLSAILILAEIINAPLLVSGYEIAKTVSSSASFVSYSRTLFSDSPSIIQSLFAFWPFKLSFYPIKSDVTSSNLLASLAIFFIAILSIGLFFDRKNNIKKKLVLALWIVYLVFICMSTATNVPFGKVFSLLLDYIPSMIFLRIPYSATHYVFLFIVSVLFGVGSAYGLNRLQKKPLFWVFLLLIIVTLLLYVNSSDIVQIVNAPRVRIPEYVFFISNYINAHNNGSSAAALPIGTPWQLTTWYWTTNVYSSLISAPFYYGGTIAYGVDFTAPISILEYYNIGNAIDNKNMSNVSISNQLGVFGIKFIIVQGDAINASKPQNFNFIWHSPNFNFSTIYANLDNAENIRFLIRYQNSSIYENKNIVPLIYASNIKYLGNVSLEKVFDAIGNSSFNVHDYSAYSTFIEGNESPVFSASLGKIYTSDNKITVMKIKNIVKPHIEFKEVSPTEFVVLIKNATTPFYLVFRETYDPLWNAYYPNWTEIDSKYHVAVNGFANAWYIDKKGDYTITLYYTLQTVASFAWILSISTFFAICYVGWWAFQKKRVIKRQTAG